jgi:type IV fimbrial biogenesis protein FimT
MQTGRSGESTWAARKRHNAAGVTLVELLVTVVVVAILAAAAMPSFREFIASQRVKTASFDLMSMLTLARSEAIKRNSTATFSGVGSGAPAVAAGGVTIRQHEPFVNLTLTCKTGGTQVACSDVTYLGNGRLAAAAPSIEIGSPASDQRSCIMIDPSGRPTSKQGAC